MDTKAYCYKHLTLVTCLFFSLFVLGCSSASTTEPQEDENPQQELEGGGEFTTQNGSIMLTGTLLLPSTPGPHPAAVIVHGSGRTTRNQYGSFAKSFFPDNGIAVLVYDKRGVGESTGSYEGVGPDNSNRVLNALADDALAWVQFLKEHNDIDNSKIGLVGASQAGWIIPLAASKSTDLAFMVNVVGPTVTVGQEIYYSSFTEGNQFQPDRTINGFTIAQLTEMTRNYTGLQGFDPAPAIRSVNIPGLWIMGDLDESIPTALCLEILEEIDQQANKNFTIQVKSNANHSLVDVFTGQQIPFVTPPGGMLDWIETAITTKN